ncbi:MAG: hypothetical protein K2X87_33515 [Gemmataceae bacterium]|nr:hypothetical protein [Gemmataceae bacterium]
MGVDYQLADGVIRFVTTGGVEYSDGAATLRAGLDAAAAADPGRRWGLLFDIRESAENRSGDELRNIADLIAARRAMLSGRAAVVVADPLHYGLGRMFGVFMEHLGLTARVFTDPAEAETWVRSS